jgi:hypothetical protein
VCSRANRWAVTALAFGSRTVDLNQCRIINIHSESAFDGLNLGLMTVRGELDTIS